MLIIQVSPSLLVLLCSHTAILLLGDGVDRVDDPRKVAEEGEQEAEPELDLEAGHASNFYQVGERNHPSDRRRSLKGRVEVHTLQPNLRRTPRGGRMMAMRMSTQFAVPSFILLRPPGRFLSNWQLPRQEIEGWLGFILVRTITGVCVGRTSVTSDELMMPFGRCFFVTGCLRTNTHHKLKN